MSMHKSETKHFIKEDSTLKKDATNSDNTASQQEGNSQSTSTTSIPKALAPEEVQQFERSTAICVKSDVYHGEPYSIVLHPTHGEVVLCHQKIEPGTWVNFMPTDRSVFVEGQFKRCAKDDEIEICQPRRPVDYIGDTIQVQAILESVHHKLNEHFNICMDALLGPVMVCKFDRFVSDSFNQGKKLEFAVAYLENCSKGYHWMAIAVNHPIEEEVARYRIVRSIPRIFDDLARTRYKE